MMAKAGANSGAAPEVEYKAEPPSVKVPEGETAVIVFGATDWASSQQPT
jgi:hypothetical protein|tara:strand:+ start:316 stop:462 length:147 start_codon:yes stop_codon:yes gene_type:complete